MFNLGMAPRNDHIRMHLSNLSENLKMLADTEVQFKGDGEIGALFWAVKNNISVHSVQLEISLMNSLTSAPFLSQYVFDIRKSIKIIEDLLKNVLPTHTAADLDQPALEKARAEAANLLLKLRGMESIMTGFPGGNIFPGLR